MSGEELLNVQNNLVDSLENVENNLSSSLINVENNLSVQVKTIIDKLNKLENDKFLEDFLNPNYYRVILPFNFDNENDYDKVVNMLENDKLYGLIATRTAKGCLHVLGWKDRDTLLYQIIEVWDKQESWLNYVNWRLYGDPTIVFPQMINSPSLPDVSTAPDEKWQPGYYDPNLVDNIIKIRKENDIYISVDRSLYTFHPIKFTLDFLVRIFGGLVSNIDIPSTKEIFPDKNTSVKDMFSETGAQDIV